MSVLLIPVLALAAAVPPAAARPSPGETGLAPVFARIDRAAAGFKTLTAGVRRLTHTDFVQDEVVDVGTIKLKRNKAHETVFVIQFTQPDPKTILFQGKKAEIYYPRMQTVDEYDLGKNREIVNQFLLLGFGSTSQELQEHYNIRLMGQQTVTGEPATELELVSKSKEVQQQIKRIELWISDSSGLPVQLKYYPSGQSIQINYSDIKRNPDLSDSELKLQLPKGVKREYPQKGS